MQLVLRNKTVDIVSSRFLEIVFVIDINMPARKRKAPARKGAAKKAPAKRKAAKKAPAKRKAARRRK